MIAFVAIFVIAFITQIAIGFNMYTGSDKMYAIDVPVYDGRVTTRFTNEYRIDSQTGRVIFDDSWRFEQMLCNNFNIKSLK